jgi:hypothetical protein
MRRGREGRTEKSIRIRSRAKIVRGGGGTPKSGVAWEVGEFGHYEDAGGCREQLFYPHSKPSLVLLCDFSNLPEPIVSRIRELRGERLRFLHAFPILARIDKGVL